MQIDTATAVNQYQCHVLAVHVTVNVLVDYLLGKWRTQLEKLVPMKGRSHFTWQLEGFQYLPLLFHSFLLLAQADCEIIAAVVEDMDKSLLLSIFDIR